MPLSLSIEMNPFVKFFCVYNICIVMMLAAGCCVRVFVGGFLVAYSHVAKTCDDN